MIVVTAIVDGLRFDISCGEGNQTFKWLGLVASQRYSLMRPHGKTRSREDSLAKVGFFLPAKVTNAADDSVIHPKSVIKDICSSDGDENNSNIMYVEIQDEVQVDTTTGNPELTAWATSAFCYNDEIKSMLSSDPAVEESIKSLDCTKESQNDGTSSSSSLVQAALVGKLSTPQEINAAVIQDWNFIDLSSIEDENTSEQHAIKDVVLDYYLTFISAFNHYSAGASPASYEMSLMEFQHFIHESSLFNMQSHSSILVKVFKEAASNASLSRPKFIQACLQLCVLHQRLEGEDDDETPVSIAIQKLVAGFFESSVKRLVSGDELRSQLHSPSVQTVLAKYYKDILKVFNERGGLNNEVITAPHVCALVRASGILYDTVREEQDATVKEAITKCFKSDELVYMELIEAIARVAVAAWKDEDETSSVSVPVEEKLELAFEGILSAHRTQSSK